MKENKYDNDIFFGKYSQMPRSLGGLVNAGEFQALQLMLPDFKDKRILDLGSGFGWHCIYAAEQGASTVIGVDISEKMLEKAREKTIFPQVSFVCSPIEDYEYPEDDFDAVISSLAFHYIKSFNDICEKVRRCLVTGGDFVFSVEHPIFTAQGSQDWIYDESGEILHWPVDRYFFEGLRNTQFLGENVVKYHRTLTAYAEALLHNGFSITGLCEPTPAEHMLGIQGMSHELRRPMMLIISAKKI